MRARFGKLDEVVPSASDEETVVVVGKLQNHRVIADVSRNAEATMSCASRCSDLAAQVRSRSFSADVRRLGVALAAR